jgi:hypothetical protein
MVQLHTAAYHQIPKVKVAVHVLELEFFVVRCATRSGHSQLVRVALAFAPGQLVQSLATLLEQQDVVLGLIGVLWIFLPAN